MSTRCVPTPVTIRTDRRWFSRDPNWACCQTTYGSEALLQGTHVRHPWCISVAGQRDWFVLEWSAGLWFLAQPGLWPRLAVGGCWQVDGGLSRLKQLARRDVHR